MWLVGSSRSSRSGAWATRTARASLRCCPRLSTPTGRCRSRGCNKPSPRRSGRPAPARSSARPSYSWIALRSGRRKRDVLRQVADLSGAGRRRVPTWPAAPGQHLEQRGLARAVGSGDEQVLAGVEVQPGYVDAVGDVRSRTWTIRPAAPAGGRARRRPARAEAWGSGPTRARVMRCSTIADPAADRAGDVLALEVVDELVVVARRPVVARPGGPRWWSRRAQRRRARRAGPRTPPPTAAGPAASRQGSRSTRR